eukprot:17121-Heterococcus_DN1.PRE.2
MGKCKKPSASYGEGNIASMRAIQIAAAGNALFATEKRARPLHSPIFIVKATTQLHLQPLSSTQVGAVFVNRGTFPQGIAHEQFNMAAFGTAFNVGVGSAVTASLTNAEVDALNPAHVSALNAALKDETAALKKFIAAEDADAVYKATHGLGTDEARLVRAA